MIRRPHIPKRLLRLVRAISIPIFLLTVAMLVRTTWIGTNDLFHFGRGGSWWCYAIINYGHVSASLDTYDPGYNGGMAAPRGKWFYFHLKANGGIWVVSSSIDAPILTAKHDFGIYQYQRFELHSRPAYTSQEINLGPILPILTILSGIVLSLWFLNSLKVRRNSIAKICPTCSYDLRAHKPGDKCPECGTPIHATPQVPPPSASPQ